MGPLAVPLLGSASSALLDLQFTRSAYLLNGRRAANLADVSGLTVTRASVGYAERVDGTLVQFASGVARITDKGLLVEEARTNLLLRSQEFDNATWAKTGATVTPDAATAPDGAITADKLVESSANSQHYISQTASLTAAGYTVSVFAKAAERRRILIRENSISGAAVAFDLVSGTIVGTDTGGAAAASGTIRQLGSTGWYLCTMTWTATAVATQTGIFLLPDSGTAVADATYLGNGSSGALIWQADEALGSFATSPIVTTSASATRAADVVSIGGLSAYAASAGTLLTTTVPIEVASAASQVTASLNDGTGNQRQSIIRTAGGTDVAYRTVVAGVETNPAVVAVTAGLGRIMAGLSFSNVRSMGAANGVLSSTAGTPAGLATFTQLMFGNDPANTQGSMYIERVALYPRAYTDAELQAATV